MTCYSTSWLPILSINKAGNDEFKVPYISIWTHKIINTCIVLYFIFNTKIYWSPKNHRFPTWYRKKYILFKIWQFFVGIICLVAQSPPFCHYFLCYSETLHKILLINSNLLPIYKHHVEKRHFKLLMRNSSCSDICAPDICAHQPKRHLRPRHLKIWTYSEKQRSPIFTF